MDRLAAMTVFVEAVDQGSLSAAGRMLGLPLATVSRRLSELEAHIGTRLLTRSTRQLALTDAGQAYLAACRRILDEVSDAEREAAGEYSAPRGELVITAPVVFGRMHVLPLVTDFLRQYPDVHVRLVLGDRSLNLLDEHVDLAIRIGALPDSSLIAVRVGEVRRVVCASPGYFAERGVPTHPNDLIAHDGVIFDGLPSPLSWVFQGDFQGDRTETELAIPIRSRLIVNSANAAIDAAIAGLGVTRVLSYQIAEAQRSGALQVVLQDYEPSAWPVQLVYARQGRLPVKLRAFIDAVVPTLRQRLSNL
jgi:DNA-binding transcriptional LysR family regulator